MRPPEIRGGALLLHGLTDSPYSLRHVAELLAQQGYYALGLRLPGHGTFPAAIARLACFGVAVVNYAIFYKRLAARTAENPAAVGRAAIAAVTATTASTGRVCVIRVIIESIWPGSTITTVTTHPMSWTLSVCRVLLPEEPWRWWVVGDAQWAVQSPQGKISGTRRAGGGVSHQSPIYFL